MRDRLAALVAIRPQDVDAGIPIERYGIDSRTLASMAGELEEWIGFQLPATLLWDYPTISEAAAAISVISAEDDAVVPLKLAPGEPSE